MSRQLVAQAQTQKPSNLGHYYGYEIFETEGRFSLIIHTSTYDGIRRDSHWATGEVEMEAQCLEDATQEAARTVAAYVRSVNPTLDSQDTAASVGGR